MGLSCGCLGAVLGLSRISLWLSWAVLGLPWACLGLSWAPRWPKIAPRRDLQDGQKTSSWPKTAPRQPQDSPRQARRPQVRSKAAQHGRTWSQDGLKKVCFDTLGEVLGPQNTQTLHVFKVFANAGSWYHQALHGFFGAILVSPWAVLALSQACASFVQCKHLRCTTLLVAHRV